MVKVNITKEVLEIEESLAKRINHILAFLGIKTEIIKGNIISLECTNIAYIEPHKLIINDTNYLFFNNCEDVYINTLETSITLTELQNHIKTLTKCYK